MQGAVQLVEQMSGSPRDAFHPINAARSRVRVTIESQNGKCLFGHYLKSGTHDILLYTSDIENDSVRGPSLRSRTRSAEDLEMMRLAKQIDDAHFKAWGKENKGKERIHYPGSPELEFYKLTGCTRGFPSIAKFEVMEDGLPPPSSPETDATRHNHQLAQAILQATSGGAASAAELAMLRAKAQRADEQQEEIATMRAQLSRMEAVITKLAAGDKAKAAKPEPSNG